MCIGFRTGIAEGSETHVGAGLEPRLAQNSGLTPGWFRGPAGFTGVSHHTQLLVACFFNFFLFVLFCGRGLPM